MSDRSGRMKKEAAMVYFKLHMPGKTFTVSQISRRMPREHG